MLIKSKAIQISYNPSENSTSNPYRIINNLSSKLPSFRRVGQTFTIRKNNHSEVKYSKLKTNRITYLVLSRKNRTD